MSALTWVGSLPDGAVSVDTREGKLVLKASRALQDRFEKLLAKKKEGNLTKEEASEYDAICELDDSLSWLNRLSRQES